MEISNIVLSLRGHDAGAVLFVLGVEEPYLLVADGKRRRVESPKRKNRKHVRFLSKSESRVAQKLHAGEKVTNNELRRALNEYKEKSRMSEQGD